MASFTPRWFTCLQAVTHRSTNWARRRVTSLQPKRITNYATPPTVVSQQKVRLCTFICMLNAAHSPLDYKIL